MAIEAKREPLQVRLGGVSERLPRNQRKGLPPSRNRTPKNIPLGGHVELPGNGHSSRQRDKLYLIHMHIRILCLSRTVCGPITKHIPKEHASLCLACAKILARTIIADLSLALQNTRHRFTLLHHRPPNHLPKTRSTPTLPLPGDPGTGTAALPGLQPPLDPELPGPLPLRRAAALVGPSERPGRSEGTVETAVLEQWKGVEGGAGCCASEVLARGWGTGLGNGPDARHEAWAWNGTQGWNSWNHGLFGAMLSSN